MLNSGSGKRKPAAGAGSAAEGASVGSQPQQDRRLRISFALESQAGDGGSDNEDVSSDEPSPSGDYGRSLAHAMTPKTPYTAKKKWDAVVQRLHENQQQIARRQPARSVEFVQHEPDSEGSDDGEERNFTKWKTLRKRLKEVKEDLQADELSETNSLHGGESMSMVEAQLVQLLSDSAGEGEQQEAVSSRSSRGLNVKVYRFRGSTLPPEEQQALQQEALAAQQQQQQQQQQVQLGAAAATPFALAASMGRVTADLAGGQQPWSGDGQQNAAAIASLARRGSQQRLEVAAPSGLSTAASCTHGREAAATLPNSLRQEGSSRLLQMGRQPSTHELLPGHAAQGSFDSSDASGCRSPRKVALPQGGSVSADLLPASRFPQHNAAGGGSSGAAGSSASREAALAAARRSSGASSSSGHEDTEVAGRRGGTSISNRPLLHIPVANGELPGEAAARNAEVAGTTGAAGGSAAGPRKALLQSLQLRVPSPSGAAPMAAAVAAAVATNMRSAAAARPGSAASATPRGDDMDDATVSRRHITAINGRILASFKVPASMYADQDDILNDADIQDLLQHVAHSCGAGAGATSHVHWHMPRTPKSTDADTYKVSTISSPGTIPGMPTTPHGAELHVHVDQEQDGRLAVVISGAEDTSHAAAGASGAAPAPGSVSRQASGSLKDRAAPFAHQRFSSGSSRVPGLFAGPAADGNAAGRGGEGYGRRDSSQMHSPAGAYVSDDGSSDVHSDLSAMGNPLVYSQRLCGRLEQHAVPDEPASPNGAAAQLERYLDTNQALKHKAGKLQATFTRHQQQQQDDAGHHQRPPLLRTPSDGLAKRVAASVSLNIGRNAPSRANTLGPTSSMARAASLSDRLGSGFGRAGMAPAGGGLLARVGVDAPADDDDKLNVEQLKREMERHLARTG